MANVTPHATPKGGFPLVLAIAKKVNGTVVATTFPTSAAVNPNDAEAETAYKKMLLLTAADTLAAAGT
jgi:hypothetical protein